MLRGDKSAILSFLLQVPQLAEQKAIASVLSSLDDKIDLLHRQNKTLESMAETLFRQWFVEEAQEDWEYTEVEEVLNTSSGGTPSRKNMAFYSGGENYWVKSKELNCSLISNTEEMITDDAINNLSAKISPPYPTLVAMYGATIGEYALITKKWHAIKPYVP